MENITLVEDTLKENEVLVPFKAFLSVPCEICLKPIEEWDDYNVKLAIESIGCGHTHCWHSEFGRLREFRKTMEKVKKAQNR